MKKRGILFSLTTLALVLFAIVIFRVSAHNTETFDPKIPVDIDVVIIDDYDQCYFIHDTSEIKRMAKLIRNISEHVGEGREFKILRFVRNNKQVLSIPYDTIGYPADAVSFIEQYINNAHICYKYHLPTGFDIEKLKNIEGFLASYKVDEADIAIFSRELSDKEKETNAMQ